MIEDKPKKYLLKSRLYKTAGIFSVFSTTVSGFLVYQFMTDWQNFKTQLDDFILVNEETLKLNLAVAFPILIALLVFLWIVLKKNRETLKNKVSLNILVVIVVLYLVYSLIEVTLAALVGAFAGSIADEFIFAPLSNANLKKYEEEHEMDREYDKEKRRIQARENARRDLDGSV